MGINVEAPTLYLSTLNSGAYDAIVFDSTVLEYLTSNDCQLIVVGNLFELFDQARALFSLVSEHVSHSAVAISLLRQACYART